MSNLTAKQEKFAQSIGSNEFDFDWMAYEKHYDTKKMSKNAIYVETCRLLQHPNVSLRVKELQAKTIKRNEVTLDEVLHEMAEWLKFNIKTIFNEDGTMKPLHQMTDQEASSIASYEVVELFGGSGESRAQIGELKKVKLIDKRAVADMFLRKLGAYIDTHKLVIEDLSYLDDILKGIAK